MITTEVLAAPTQPSLSTRRSTVVAFSAVLGVLLAASGATIVALVAGALPG